jgi:hypothetical protein
MHLDYKQVNVTKEGNLCILRILRDTSIYSGENRKFCMLTKDDTKAEPLYCICYHI